MKNFINRQIAKKLGGYQQLINKVDQSLPMKSEVSKKVAVVGAGIAGMSAATVLAERGFNIDSTIGISVSYSLTTQFIIEGLAAGTYELKVQVTAQAEVGSDRVEHGLLYIHTYK